MSLVLYKDSERHASVYQKRMHHKKGKEDLVFEKLVFLLEFTKDGRLQGWKAATAEKVLDEPWDEGRHVLDLSDTKLRQMLWKLLLLPS